MHDDLGGLAHVLEFLHDLAAQRNLFVVDLGDCFQGHLDIVDKGKQSPEEFGVASLIGGADPEFRARGFARLNGRSRYHGSLPLAGLLRTGSPAYGTRMPPCMLATWPSPASPAISGSPRRKLTSNPVRPQLQALP